MRRCQEQTIMGGLAMSLAVVCLAGCAAVDHYLGGGVAVEKEHQPIVNAETAFKYMMFPKVRDGQLLFDGRTPDSLRTKELNFARDVFVMNDDGSGLKNLTSTPDRHEVSGGWDDEGRVLYYDAGLDWKDVTYYRINADGTGRTAVNESLYRKTVNRD